MPLYLKRELAFIKCILQGILFSAFLSFAWWWSFCKHCTFPSVYFPQFIQIPLCFLQFLTLLHFWMYRNIPFYLDYSGFFSCPSPINGDPFYVQFFPTTNISYYEYSTICITSTGPRFGTLTSSGHIARVGFLGQRIHFNCTCPAWVLGSLHSSLTPGLESQNFPNSPPGTLVIFLCSLLIYRA